MTCIVGIAKDGKVHIGGDSAGVHTGSFGLSVRVDRKVFINGPFVMGFTTSFRMGQLLAFKLRPPKFHVGEDPMTFMVTEFVDAVRECLKAGGYARKMNEEEAAGTFLVGFQGRLFSIHDDYQVAEAAVGYAACGCASDVALGSLHASAIMPLEPERRLELALDAAQCFSAGVRAPFHFEVGGATA